jgi:FKBP-type peptidyl-prolyl cis-trans isomerase FklB
MVVTSGTKLRQYEICTLVGPARAMGCRAWRLRCGRSFIALAAVFIFFPACGPSKSAEPTSVKTKTEKFSYALGMNFGTNLGNTLKKQSVDVDWNLVAQGLKASTSGGKTLLTEDEAKTALADMQKEVQEQRQAKAKVAGEKNKTEGEAFLAANKAKEGVVTLPDGLQYKILTAGKGPKPAASDSVVCYYRGTLISGTEFDSSYKRGQPATFGVGQVIKGWTEALQLMPVGSKWQVVIPPNLAYGERGAGADVGPNSTLLFEVELLSIVDKQANKNKAVRPPSTMPAAPSKQ